MNTNHDELLAAAVDAYRSYELTVEQAKRERTEAFQRALRGPVSGREIADELGISQSMVSRIAAGKR